MKSNKAQSFLLLSVVLCLVLGIVTYMYLYKPQLEEIEKLESTNMVLAVRVEELMAFNEEMPENMKKIEEMTADIKEKLKNFL